MHSHVAHIHAIQLYKKNEVARNTTSLLSQVIAWCIVSKHGA
jgi:hypothetical protein